MVGRDGAGAGVPPMLGKQARVGQKLLVSWSKIVGTFSNFAIKFHNFAKN